MYLENIKQVMKQISVLNFVFWINTIQLHITKIKINVQFNNCLYLKNLRYLFKINTNKYIFFFKSEHIKSLITLGELTQCY